RLDVLVADELRCDVADIVAGEQLLVERAGGGVRVLDVAAQLLVPERALDVWADVRGRVRDPFLGCVHLDKSFRGRVESVSSVGRLDYARPYGAPQAHRGRGCRGACCVSTPLVPRCARGAGSQTAEGGSESSAARLRSDSARRREASSMSSPSKRTAPCGAARIRFARSISAGDGVKTRCTGAIWLGWMTHLPS